MENEVSKSKRRSFYIDDDLWFKFQSRLWADRTNATKWVREAIRQYLEDQSSNN